MKVGKNGQPQGYTIIEVMIFLAISGGLLASALLALSGSKARAEFSFGVQEFAAQLTDVANDVSTGYYLNPGVTCTVNGGNRPALMTGDDSDQGTNADCVFVGRVVQFGNANAEDVDRVYVTHSVVGRRLKTDGSSVSNLQESKPVSLRGDGVDGTEEIRIPGGMTIVWATANGTNAGAIGYFSSFLANEPTAGELQSGANNINIILLGNSVSQSIQQIADAIENVDEDSINPSEGVRVCVNSGGTDQHAILTIGGSGSRFNPDIQIDSGGCDDAA